MRKTGSRAKIFALANQKGGVGKTTSAVNLSAAVAAQGKKTLLIDSDPQGNGSSASGINIKKTKDNHLYHCFVDKKNVHKAIQQSPHLKNLAILPTDIDLIGVEMELPSEENREFFLKKIISEVEKDYEYIFIDCPPSLGILTVNALCAADAVVIPLQCEYFALEGLSQLVRTIKIVKTSYNKQLKIEGLLLTMYDRRNKLTYQVAKEVKNHFKDKVYKTVIPRNVRLSESPSHGKPVMIYDKGSSGAISYMNLGKEFIKRQEQGRK